jgi:phosphoadenosine phosphosulfate reductase
MMRGCRACRLSHSEIDERKIMELGTVDIPEIAKSLAERHPIEIVQFALENYSNGIGISFSGAEDVVLVDLAAKVGGKFRVFSLDTGRLHP